MKPTLLLVLFPFTLVGALACHRKVTANAWPAEMQTTTAEEAVAAVKDARGNPTLLVLYASWCTPCRAELPAVDAFAKRHPEVRLRAFALDEDPQDFAEMLEEHTIHFPLVRIAPLAKDDLVAGVKSLGGGYVGGLPFSAMFDRQGKIVREWQGKSTEADLEAALASAR